MVSERLKKHVETLRDLWEVHVKDWYRKGHIGDVMCHTWAYIGSLPDDVESLRDPKTQAYVDEVRRKIEDTKALLLQDKHDKPWRPEVIRTIHTVLLGVEKLKTPDVWAPKEPPPAEPPPVEAEPKKEPAPPGIKPRLEALLEKVREAEGIFAGESMFDGKERFLSEDNAQEVETLLQEIGEGLEGCLEQ